LAGAISDLEDRLPLGETRFESAELEPRRIRTWNHDLGPAAIHVGEAVGCVRGDDQRLLGRTEVGIAPVAGHKDDVVRARLVDEIGLLARNRRNGVDALAGRGDTRVVGLGLPVVALGDVGTETVRRVTRIECADVDIIAVLRLI